ncbi:hypothetical protein HDU79_003938, partial [Rhizoclosmatium sp. JEL0117]
EGTYFSYVLRSLGLSKASSVQRAGASVGVVVVVSLFVWAAVEFGAPPPVNVIMLVSDGFGPASQTLARNYNAFIKEAGPELLLPLDSILVGSSRTRSSSSLVTDSAAGATAFSCALKSYNGAIGVNSDGVPCGTILEAAKLKGYMTGLVATSRITHATPASFSAHVIDREMEDEIAVQQIGNYSLGRMVDLAFGGGSCHFKPQTGSNAGSCRADDLDLLSWGVEKYRWNILESVDVFRNLDVTAVSLPLLGLFTPDHMSFEIDRDDTQEPSLKEMAIKALDILSYATRRSRKGFFIMIEGSRIDMAAHINDPAAHVHDILQYNHLIEAVIGWVNNHPNTVMISTSDHETGGLSVAHELGNVYPDYAWYPEVLRPVQNSTEKIARYLISYPNKSALPTYITETVLPQWLGIKDATKTELDFLTNPNRTAAEYQEFLGIMVSDRAGLGWATHGHSAVDVNLYAHGYKSELLRGNHENTDIGLFMQAVLNVDLQSVTSRLAAGSWWKEALGRFNAFSKNIGQSAGYNKLHYHEKTPAL